MFENIILIIHEMERFESEIIVLAFREMMAKICSFPINDGHRLNNKPLGGRRFRFYPKIEARRSADRPP